MFNKPICPLLDFILLTNKIEHVLLSRLFTVEFVLEPEKLGLVFLKLSDLLFEINLSCAGVAALVKLPVRVFFIEAGCCNFFIFNLLERITLH